MESKRIIFLDYLRIFAFLSVFIGHKFYGILLKGEEYITNFYVKCAYQKLVLPFFDSGAAGVVVFFLISGYIITNVLTSEYADKNGKFLVKRFFRIYPLYIFCVLVYSLSLIIKGDILTIKTFLLQILLIGDFFGVSYSLSGVEWTLRVEVLFYVIMALLKKIRVLQLSSTKLWLVYLGMLILFSCLPFFPGKNDFTYGYYNLYFPYLFLGSAIFLTTIYRLELWKCIALSFLTLTSTYFNLFMLDSRFVYSPYLIYSLLLFNVLLFFNEKLLNARAILILSEITYAVYLTHNWAYAYCNNILLKFLGGDFLIKIISMILSFIFILCLSFVLNRVIEKNGIKFGKYLLK